MILDSSLLEVCRYLQTKWYFSNKRQRCHEEKCGVVCFIFIGWIYTSKYLYCCWHIAWYTRAVNTYYKKCRFNVPFDEKSETDAAKLLSEQAKLEGKPEQQEPLHERVLVHMMELSRAGHHFGFRRAVFLDGLSLLLRLMPSRIYDGKEEEDPSLRKAE